MIDGPVAVDITRFLLIAFTGPIIPMVLAMLIRRAFTS